LLAGTESLGVADAGMGGSLRTGLGPPGTAREFDVEREPRGLVRREIGWERLLRCEPSGQCRIHEAGCNATNEHLCRRSECEQWNIVPSLYAPFVHADNSVRRSLLLDVSQASGLILSPRLLVMWKGRPSF